MKINYIKGDLLSVTEGIIVHGCNAQGVMGSGVALAVRQKYPKAYSEYKSALERDCLELGEVQCIQVSDSLYVINAITQFTYGRVNKRYASYDAISSCFDGIFSIARGSKQEILSVPKIGAGLGGGDWEVILSIIKESAEKQCYTGVLNVYEL